ncbi:ninjurin-A-like [Anopheles darlingi]|uniref:ninjurin-A-like n=1 Tax=Anopheles darlingi TaxID=43151 RepID=UPI0021000E38|nr:ninjurin-A-like [Anopheles darlingi]
METNGDKNVDAVEINIEGEMESIDVPDAGRNRAAAQPQPRRGRRSLSPGAANNTPGEAAASAASTNGRRSRSSSRSPGRRKRDTEMALADAVPLLPGGNHTGEADLPRQRPPIAGPEMDDEDEEDAVDKTTRFDPNDPDRGIDNGFLEPSEERSKDDRGSTDRADRRGGGGGGGRRNQGPAFPYAPGFAPDGTVQTTNSGEVIPDVNVYQQKKNLAQGMMDLALLSANANQLRYVLDSGKKDHPYYYINLVFISSSIIAQVAVGIGLIWKSRYNIKREADLCKADRINNLVTIGIFIITIVNVLISAFGMADTNPSKT